MPDGNVGRARAHKLYIDKSSVEELGAGTTHFVLLGKAVKAEDSKPLDRHRAIECRARTSTRAGIEVLVSRGRCRIQNGRVERI